MNPAVYSIYTVRALRLSPSIMERLFERISPRQFDERLAPDRFSVREVIAHLADFEPVWLERIKACAENPGSTVLSRDEDQMAIDGAYSKSDPKALIKAFSRSRGDLVTYLESLNSDQLTQTVIHSELGEVSLMELAYLVVGHDAYHIEQLTQFLG